MLCLTSHNNSQGGPQKEIRHELISRSAGKIACFVLPSPSDVLRGLQKAGGIARGQAQQPSTLDEYHTTTSIQSLPRQSSGSELYRLVLCLLLKVSQNIGLVNVKCVRAVFDICHYHLALLQDAAYTIGPEFSRVSLAVRHPCHITPRANILMHTVGSVAVSSPRANAPIYFLVVVEPLRLMNE